MEAWALQQEVFNGLEDNSTPRAVWVRRQAYTMQVSGDSCMAQTKAGEGDIEDAGLFPYPLWLW